MNRKWRCWSDYADVSCNRLICAIDVRKGIKQLSLWPGSTFFIASRGAQKGQLQIMARVYLFFIASRGGQKEHCRIMNFFFFFFWRSVGWLWGVGGGCIGICHPPLPLPHPIHIYLSGCGGWRDRLSEWLALEIIKLAEIIFAAYLHIRQKVLFVLGFYGPVNTI